MILSNLNDLKTKLEAKGIKFDTINGMFGYRKKFVWYWFSVYDDDKPDQFMIFNHSYSQNTGKVSRGRIARNRAESTLEKVLGFDQLVNA